LKISPPTGRGYLLRVQNTSSSIDRGSTESGSLDGSTPILSLPNFGYDALCYAFAPIEVAIQSSFCNLHRNYRNNSPCSTGGYYHQRVEFRELQVWLFTAGSHSLFSPSVSFFKKPNKEGKSSREKQSRSGASQKIERYPSNPKKIIASEKDLDPNNSYKRQNQFSPITKRVRRRRRPTIEIWQKSLT
jgi:hypothetical protein